MTRPYEVVDVVPDSPAWEAARLHSLGASEVPAVLGVSPYATRLDVYRAKFGDPRPLDPELAFIGHAEELTVGRWLRKFHPELGVIRRGYMARSTIVPWLHASFDRFVLRRGAWTPVQIKTAHQFAGDDWVDGVPLAVQVQVQTELLVHGGDLGWVVAFVGGRRFHLHPVERDQAFIDEVLIPDTEAFWRDHVQAQVPPDPSSTAEAARHWRGEGGIIEADEELVALWEQLGFAQNVKSAAEAEVDRLKLALQLRMRESTELVDDAGRTLVTWRAKRGATRVDLDRLRADHPDLIADYLVQSEGSRTFLRKKIRQEIPA